MIYQNEYMKRKRKQIKLLLRLYLGVQQLRYHPLKSLVLVVLIMLYGVVWKIKPYIYTIVDVPQMFVSVFDFAISFVLIVACSLCVLAYIEKVGEVSARRDEACLIMAFKPQDLRNGHPILFSKRKIKNSEVIVREFYSNIGMQRWCDLKGEIEDSLNVCLIAPYCEYGGKEKNKGNRIVLYAVPNRKLKDRGILYEDVF